MSEIAEEDVVRTFFRERKLNGDFISKITDFFWQKEAIKFVNVEPALADGTPQQPEQVEKNPLFTSYIIVTMLIYIYIYILILYHLVFCLSFN